MVATSSAGTPAFRDPALPAGVRARDLLQHLTLEEKVAMLHQHAPAVERLGLAAFRTGTEALHGVAWLGTATVFPQPVGLAATWDAELVRRVGAAVGAEVRARHVADPSVSLNVWAPVVNPLRHPRWGRNEEGFSEDPSVTAWLAEAYARGLRGDHPTYWRTVPTLKHLVGYGNETDRAVTDSQLRPRVLHEYELAAFRGPVRAGVVGAVMPSYNLVNGRPAHVAADILDEVRSWTTVDLLAVSDAGAPSNLAGVQRYYPDDVVASAAALRAGIDSFTDHDRDPRPTIERITAALDRGLVAEEDVDRAVRRLLELRIRTGELDPTLDPFRAGDVDAAAHSGLAREAATASVVVLANDGLLPLPGSGRVAVVGPHADRVLTDWYSGSPGHTVTIADALREAWGADADADADADAVIVTDGAERVAWRCVATGTYVRADPGGALVADAPAASPDTHVDVTDWGDGVCTLRSAESGRLWSGAHWPLTASAARVGGWIVQEAFRTHRQDDGTWSLRHEASGRWVAVQRDGLALVAETTSADAAARFVRRSVRSGHEAVARAAAAADTVVVTAGNDPHLLGRETQDRPHLRLPHAQLELWRAAREANPRAVLALVSSYPYALDDETCRAAGAIVWSSHGGQELGHGVADVLLGAVEPSGRLAQAWPADEGHAGDLFDYDVIAGGLTSWYSPHAPRWPLGHGLTYTRVTYTALDAPATASGGQLDAELVVTVRVTNDGDRAARELVQLYASAPRRRLPVPSRRLVAHRRMDLTPGATADVELRFRVGDLAVWDTSRDRWVVEPGRYALRAGGSAADLPLLRDLEVTGTPVPPRALAAGVDAADADELDGVRLAPRTAERGDAVEVAPRRETGTVVWWDVALAGGALAVDVARRGPGAAHVRLEVRRPSGEEWTAAGDAVVPDAAGPFDWTTVRLCGRAPDGVHDVRAVLAGPVRLATLRPA